MMPFSTLIERNPDILAGTSVLVGTRVPVQMLLDYLAAGETIDEFVDDFPTVSRAQVVAVLDELKLTLLKAAHESAA